jgi:hypothetical protein
MRCADTTASWTKFSKMVYLSRKPLTIVTSLDARISAPTLQQSSSYGRCSSGISERRRSLTAMEDVREGGCLCGAVRYRVIGDPLVAGVCHCTFCKRRTGSAFGVSAYFADASVQILSGQLKTYEYRSDESGRWMRMEFCPTCGTTVTATAEAFPTARWIAVGTFDDPNWIKPSRHAWTRSALHWMVFPRDVEIFKTTSLK